MPSDSVLSGTVIMRELWQSSSLRSGARDWLTIFEACVIKSSNESVVESMGMIIDLHAAPGRHPDPEVYAIESFVHWNGPVLSRSRRMLTAALNLHFKGKRWNFTNTHLRGDKLAFKQVSLVVDRVRAEKSRLPFVEDPVRVSAAVEEEEDADYADILDAPQTSDNNYEVEKLLDYRMRNGVEEWRVHWKGYAVSRSTWEPMAHLESAGEEILRQAAALRPTSRNPRTSIAAQSPASDD